MATDKELDGPPPPGAMKVEEPHGCIELPPMDEPPTADMLTDTVGSSAGGKLGDGGRCDG